MDVSVLQLVQALELYSSILAHDNELLEASHRFSPSCCGKQSARCGDSDVCNDYSEVPIYLAGCRAVNHRAYYAANHTVYQAVNHVVYQTVYRTVFRTVSHAAYHTVSHRLHIPV